MTSKILIINGEVPSSVSQSSQVENTTPTQIAQPVRTTHTIQAAPNTLTNNEVNINKSLNIDLSKIQIGIHIDCDQCDGYGTVTIPAGDIKYDLQSILQQDNKGAIHDVNNIQSYLASLPKSIPGITDRNRKEGCVKCGGSGKKHKIITLSELKELLQ